MGKGLPPLASTAPPQARSRSGRGKLDQPSPLRLSPESRRRSAPHVLLGLILVVGSALAFTVVTLRSDDRREVLALAQSVPAGHVLRDEDLRVLRVGAGPEAALLPAAERTRATGQQVSVPLAAGTLLSNAHIGQAAWPPTGKAIVGIAVQPGQYPPDLRPGSLVEVLVATQVGDSPIDQQAAGTATPSEPRSLGRGVVTEITSGRAGQPGAVIAVLIDADSARKAASAQDGQVRLVLLHPGEGGS